ncbi:glycosyltransferase [Roseateles asaccharophilus]|uniref:Glycosyltransferase involved in cell wall biosynthesis n=1 Tax=Roseateles asaccharophilus TaxID=582607 RepID=A0ABU2A5K8_9BURK|nr:glycosyltransferase [Roseateles asaccharophilus]MDR7332431.1 glycosyltransferase involved in cell wall biosynthesis [Roseateles asaccharophilus]
MSTPQPSADRPKVVHFVTGGFSGATQVAVDLCLSALHGGPFEPVLVLRRKRQTPMARVEALRAQGLAVHLVSGWWSHLPTIAELATLLREIRPLALLAHGFPEHLIGRQAGLRAGVPVLMQVEHNSRERYTPWSRWLSRRLADKSAALVGVSEGVRQSLLAQGLPADKTVAIPNGIDLARFADAGVEREAGLLMSARFARQKDHATLIDAMALLAAQGQKAILQLAGTGPLLARMQAKAARLKLSEQVRFLGHHGDMPGLLRSQRIYVLATHFEGMPLALVEAMAAGCACIASDVIGVRGVIEHEHTGLLVPEGDSPALAAAIARLLGDPALAARLGAAARERAFAEHGVALMRQRYEDLISRCATTAGRAASARA